MFNIKTAFLGLSAVSMLTLPAGAFASASTEPTRSELAGPEHAMPQSSDPWFTAAQKRLSQIKSARPEARTAKNVILFVGDGMSIATITSGGILEGQSKGGPGEGNLLSFETMPYAGLIKTYTTDFQTPDSAGTATAMVTGIKTKSLIISMDDTVEAGVCGSGNAAMTIMELAEEAGLSTGIVTSTRLTHATPATNFAHSPSRQWETDGQVKAGANGEVCADIASQLIDTPFGDGPEVALGGGRSQFMPNTENDPEDEARKGYRKDGRNLTTEWTLSRPKAAYVWNKSDFDKINVANTSRLLGLFQPSHMQFDLDRPDDKGGEPSLSEMTSKAIDLLEQNDEGFYLMVEGGRIDHAHHGTNAARALTDTVAFSDAIRTALEKTNPEETLIIVTSDHAHTISISGYANRGNPILGKVRSGENESKGSDGMPYTTLSYANGGSAKREGPRADLTEVDTTHKDFRQPSLVPMMSETHSGEDVAIYASGPGAQWVSGVYEQNYIFHVMEEATQLRKKAANAK